MADASDFQDLLTQSRMSRLRKVIESRSVDVHGFVSAYISTLPGGLAGALAPEERDATVVLLRRLGELFARIDVLGAASVNWLDITRYLGETTFPSRSALSASSDAVKSLVYRPSEAGAREPGDDLPPRIEYT